MGKTTRLFFCIVWTFPIVVFGQKKPLDHSVYDAWQSTSNLNISNNGKFISYEVNPQEGDGDLYIQKENGDTLLKVQRGYLGKFLPNSSYFICKIKPTYSQSREAKIRKKSEDEMPKDSLAIINLSESYIRKIPNIKSFKISEKEGNIVAWLSENAKKPEIKLDSLAKLKNLEKEIDSLQLRLTKVKSEGFNALKTNVTDTKKKKIKEDGFAFTILNLKNGDSSTLPFVKEYTISNKGENGLIIEGHNQLDSTYKVIYFSDGKLKPILENGLSIKNLSLSEDGTKASFIADLDSTSKALRNFYNLYYYTKPNEKAEIIVTKNAQSLYTNWQINEYTDITFTPSGNKIIFGTSPILPLKDTSLPEFERVNLDIWHYNEDDLHTVQLYNLAKDLKKNYKSVYNLEDKKAIQIENEDFERAFFPMKGDSKFYYTSTDTGRRVEKQWLGRTHSDIYSINAQSGEKQLLFRNVLGMGKASYTGKYFTFYDTQNKKLYIYNALSKSKIIVQSIPFPIYDEENDVPAEPGLYGIMGWSQNDANLYIYDKYDIWKINPENGKATQVTNFGRKNNIIARYIQTDEDMDYIEENTPIVLDLFYEKTKNNQYINYSLNTSNKADSITALGQYKVSELKKSKDIANFIYTKQNYSSSPNVYLNISEKNTIQLSDINKQQSNYNWGNAELYKWKSYTGKETEGILYKPEDFNSSKKYPMITYFYERNNETLYNYLPPAPTPSRLNISFFVSRGYIVFVPDIWYKDGHPGQSSYDFIVSGIRSILKKGFVDSTKLGVQGQSWGGYQTAYLITKVPNLFAAAWAGAPVVNMFSAYGGIRWESGMNRQFQYEKTQSRIGKTIWEKPELYIENSPLFNLPKVKTPVVIMSNDADGAVPWYQGIEMFTDLRRLGKKAWLLDYNGEAHNLIQRKNRKDISIREQQFFDWLLKGEKPAPWITDGVPATMKGRTWGL